jgi:predicted ATP-dependent endonuclease of OLD family
MRLRKFRVRAYRCIHDSGEIRVGDLAAFVGRNESGKTTILQALTLLNREHQLSDLDLCDEMSEELKNEVMLAEGDFDLNHNETRIIKDSFPNIPEIKKIKIFRTNNSPIAQYDFGDVNISEAENSGLNSWENFIEKVSNFLDTIPNHIRIKLNTQFFEGQTPETEEIFRNQMAEFGNNLHVLATDEPEITIEWEKIAEDPNTNFQNLLIGTTERIALENFIDTNLHPRFVYFSDYKKIIGNINLNEYGRMADKSSIEFSEDEFDKTETVDNLFYLAELDINELEECKNSPSQLIKLLNTCGKRLTEKLNPAWKGDAIHVELRLNPNNIMSVVISDVHKDGTVTNTGILNRRAEGFKWTFSFIVNFAAETQKAELKEAILLLDEPARNLHPTQQRGISDLLKNLAGSNQVLYATHSPFMIFDYAPGNLLVVELDKKKHLSRIYYDYWNADDLTLTPILYGLSRGLVESIVDREIGYNSRPVIIVETMADTMYLNAFDKFLEDPNISMNPLNIIAAYNKNSVLPLAIFYRNHGYNTFVLLDNTKESRDISTQLVANEFTKIQTIFFEHDSKALQSIEDYMLPDDYLYAVNQTYAIKLRKEGYVNLTNEIIKSKNKTGILEGLESIWTEHKEDEWENFDSEEVCRYICEKIAMNEAEFLTDKTKDRIRSLYRLIAERIRQQQNLLSNQSSEKRRKMNV